MRLRTPLFGLACIGLISFVGCGGAGIGTLRNGEVSAFSGSYGGRYEGTHGEVGNLSLSIARDASFVGTITMGPINFPPQAEGPVTGVVAKNGHFKMSYHFNNSTTVYSGTGIMTEPVTIPASTSTDAMGVTTMTPAMRGFSGVLNLTSPSASTLSFTISGVTGT